MTESTLYHLAGWLSVSDMLSSFLHKEALAT